MSEDEEIAALDHEIARCLEGKAPRNDPNSYPTRRQYKAAWMRRYRLSADVRARESAQQRGYYAAHKADRYIRHASYRNHMDLDIRA